MIPEHATPDPRSGLTSHAAARLLAEHGPNALPDAPPMPWWRRVLEQLRSSIIYILIFALIFDLVVWVTEGAQGFRSSPSPSRSSCC